MKRVLFVIQRVDIGGSVSSLLNLLEILKEAGNKLDLFIMEHTGIFMARARGAVNVLPEDWLLASTICDKNVVRAKYGLKGYINRIYIFMRNCTGNSTEIRESIYRKAASKITGYDIVIAYQENAATNFAKYIPARKRIAWVHTIYERFSTDSTHQQMVEAYNMFDHIVCVAKASAVSLYEGLPEMKDKVRVIPNPFNKKLIKEKAKESPAIILDRNQEDNKIIVSVGRLSPEKQYDFAIEAAYRLIKDGVNFKWYIIGDGAERDHLKELIDEKYLSKHVIMTGALQNPYPVIAAADVLVITSLYEAQPMVANEALILGIPVITTNYPSAYELINTGKDGIICENTVAGITATVKLYLCNDDCANELKEGARSFTYDSQEIVDTILDMCADKTK